MRQIQLKNKLLKNKVIWDFQKLQNNLETPVWTCTPEKTSVLKNMRNIEDFVESVTVLRNPSLELFNVMLSRCYDWSDAPLSTYIIKTMKKLNIKPNIESYFFLLHNWGPHRTLNYNYSIELMRIIIRARKDCVHSDFFLNQSDRFKDILASVVLSGRPEDTKQDEDDLNANQVREERANVEGEEMKQLNRSYDNKSLGSLQAYCMYLLTDPVDGNIHGPSFLNGIQCALKLVYDLAKYNEFARNFVQILDAEMKETNNNKKVVSQIKMNDKESKMGEVIIPAVNGEYFDLDTEDKCFLDIALLRICSVKGYKRTKDFIWQRLRANAAGNISMNLVIKVWSSCIQSLIDTDLWEHARDLTLQSLSDQNWISSIQKENVDILVEPYLTYLQREGKYEELQQFFVKYLINNELSKSYCLLILQTYLRSPSPSLSNILALLDGFPVKVKTSISAHNKVLRYLMDKGSFENAESYFNKLIEQGIIPNSTSYNIILQGLLATQKTSELINFFTYMKSIQKDDMHTYSLLLTELPKIWELQAAKAGFVYGRRRPKLFKKRLGTLSAPKENYKDPCKFQKIFFNALLQDVEERGFSELRNKFIHYYHQSHQHYQVMDYYRFHRKIFDFQPSALIDIMDSASRTKNPDIVDDIFDDVIYKKKYIHAFTPNYLNYVVSTKLKTVKGFAEKVEFIKKIQRQEFGNVDLSIHLYNMLVATTACRREEKELNLTLTIEDVTRNLEMVIQKILKEPTATRTQIQKTIDYLKDYITIQTNKSNLNPYSQQGQESFAEIMEMMAKLSRLQTTLPE